MSVSNNLGILQVTESQSQKMSAVNQALSQIEDALSEIYEIDVSSSVDGSTNDFVLTYDVSDDLSDRAATRMIYLKVTGNPTFDFTITHPQTKHLFFVSNQTAQNCVIRTISGISVSVPKNSGNIIYCDGTDVEPLLAAQNTNYVPIDCQFWGKPGSSEVMARHLAFYDIVVQEDEDEIVGKVGTNPASSFVMEVFEDGGKRGEITVSTTGEFTYNTTSISGPITFNAGNEIIIYAPATVDADIEDIRFSLKGTASVLV